LIDGIYTCLIKRRNTRGLLNFGLDYPTRFEHLKINDRDDSAVGLVEERLDQFLGAYLEEPHVWATLTDRDSIIFEDNDFEVFIDPDGDTHNYYELEMNALNTVWDLLLIKPYRDGGPAVHSWDIQGLQTAVNVLGTLNDPTDRDKAWTLEIALPFAVLKECIPGKPERPLAGDQWRVNFSRVEYYLDAEKGKYAKAKGTLGQAVSAED